MKDKIIKSALELFAEKGFHNTSVQEIANHANIAKGTLYAHFTSKKSILVAIYEYYLDCLYNSLDHKITSFNEPFEKRLTHLSKVLYDYLSVALDHEDFLIMQMKEQNINDQQVMNFIQEKRGKIYLKFQHLMKYVGGEELNHCVLDVAIILNSLIEEYSTVVILDGADISIEELITFIMETIICIFKGFRNKEISPILSQNYIRNKTATENLSSVNKIQEKLRDINQLINNIYLTSEVKQEIDYSIKFIKNEITKKEPDAIIIKGVLRNIAQVEELQFIVEELLTLLEKITK
ncbi:TetR/AcrR family transcriptional regulator [Metabacillus niabensis]|uniref:TetR/AcrR family transcriptional regulator n=1 Tax=Metabacillus niabensis TaxID=324854 RepID=UPI00399F071F